MAGRDDQPRRFARLIEDYPEKRGNLRISGLRGVGKTVLLKEFERTAKHAGWVVVRRDLSPRLCDENAFATAIADYMRDAVEQLSVVARIKGKVADAAKSAIGQVSVDLGDGVTVSPGTGRSSEPDPCSKTASGSRSPNSELRRVAGASRSSSTRRTRCTTSRRSSSIRSARCSRHWLPPRTTMITRCRS
jgi:hypothetical protein